MDGISQCAHAGEDVVDNLFLVRKENLFFYGGTDVYLYFFRAEAQERGKEKDPLLILKALCTMDPFLSRKGP